MLHAFRDDERRRITVTATGTVSFVDLVTFVERSTGRRRVGVRGAPWRTGGYDRRDGSGLERRRRAYRRDRDSARAWAGGGWSPRTSNTSQRRKCTRRCWRRAGGRIAVFSTIAEASEWLDRQFAEAESGWAASDWTSTCRTTPGRASGSMIWFAAAAKAGSARPTLIARGGTTTA